MLDSAIYYIESESQDGRSQLSHDGVIVASFASHEDALRLATHLARSASEMGMYARVVERAGNRRPAIIFEREPIDDAHLPWDAIDG